MEESVDEMLGLLDRPEWQSHGACNGDNVGRWFPVRGQPIKAQREVCRGCAVQEDCLEYALANSEKFGIWGGLSERERRRVRARRGRVRRKDPAA